MIKVRRSTFETNSSSTHTITIVSREEYDGWRKGKYLYDRWSQKLVPARQLTEYEKRDAKEQYEINRKSYWKTWDEMDEYDRDQVYGEYTAKLMEGTYNLMTEKQYDEWCGERGMETSCVSYTTASGDGIVAFGYGGYDG